MASVAIELAARACSSALGRARYMWLPHADATQTHRFFFFLIASTGWLKRLRAPEKAPTTDERSSDACRGPPSMSTGVCIPDGLCASAQSDWKGRDGDP